MKIDLTFYVIFILSLSGLVRADDLLDQKLNALKEKAHRRVYSARATVEAELDVSVPQEISDEEKELDKKIRQMEKELDATGFPTDRPVVQRNMYARPVPKKNENWLTPALFDNASEENSALQEPDDNWIMGELTRQKELKEQRRLSRAEEKQLVDQRLRETLQNNSISPVSSLNNSPDTSRRFFGVTQNSASEDNKNPFLRTSSESSFARLSADQDSENSSRQRSTFNSRSQSVGSTPYPSTSSGLFETKPEEPIRKRFRPTRNDDPFGDNLMPKLKKSIWD